MEAESVGAAKAFVLTMKFNLIVTDLSMPGEDGAAFLTWLREQPRAGPPTSASHRSRRLRADDRDDPECTGALDEALTAAVGRL